VPGWNDQEEYLHEWGKTFGHYKTVEQAELLPYHTLGVYKFKELGMDYQLKDVKPPTPESVAKSAKILEQYFSKVVVK
jgi:pyruvate formate lyase activating enzyme